jgi:hypothetical protein
MNGSPTAGSKSLGDRLRDNLVVFFLTTLLTGFLAGIGTCKAVLEMAGLTTVGKSELARLQSQSQPAPPAMHSRTLTISNVEPGASIPSVEAFRLMVRINKVTYSMPVNSVWAERSMAWGPFTVPMPPADDGRYFISFSAFFRQTGGAGQHIMPQPVQTVRDTEVPLLKEYDASDLKVNYKVE